MTFHLYPSALARDAALAQLPPAAWTDGHLTFAEFARQLDRQLPAKTARRVLSDDARQMLLLSALRELPVEDRERLGANDAALASVGALVTAWRSIGLAERHLRAAAKRLGKKAPAQTLALLASVLKRYEALLGNEWLDREGHERQLLERLESGCQLPLRLLPPGECIELHGFHRLIDFQRRVLERLQALGHAVALVPDCELPPKHRETLGELKSRAPQPGVPREHLRIEAATPYAEVYEIGRRVHGWMAKDGVLPERIGIAFRDLGPYSQAVHDVFKRFGIPFYERRGEPLVFQPLTRVALSALQAAADGLPCESVFRFVCAGPIDLAGLAKLPPRGSEGITPADLHSLARDASIDRFFGAEAQAPLSAWRAKLLRYVERPSSDTRERRAATFLLAILARLDSLRARGSLREHGERFAELLADAGLTAAALSASPLGDQEKDQEALALLHQALAALADGPLAGVEMQIEDFARCVEMALQQQSVRAGGDARGGVRVLNLYDLRGLRFSHLVLGGMAEGVFPPPPAIDPLIGAGGSALVRRALAAELHDERALQFVEPRLSAECIDEERTLFDIARASAAEGMLFFTRPRADFEGCALGPSIFWDAISASAATESASAIHPAPALADCITLEERELRSAWVLGGAPCEQAEVSAAKGEFAASARLQSAARRAVVERARRQFFEQQVSEVSRQVLAPGDYDGTAADAAALLNRTLLAPDPKAADAPTLSPSDIETLAGCRFRFMNERLFRFEELAQAEPELSRLDKGQLLHDVLAQFYKQQLAAGGVVAVLRPELKKQYLESLHAITQTILERATAEKFTGHPALWQMEREKIAATLEKWLERELVETHASGWYVAQVEFEFGGENVPPVALEIGATNLLLSGRMDRLDFRVSDPGAAHPVVRAVRVVDYKLGGNKSYTASVRPENLQKLLAAQLPIYLKAALAYLKCLAQQQRISVDLDSVMAESQAGYYCLRDVAKQDAMLLVKKWPLGNLDAYLSDDPQLAGSLFNAVRANVARVLQGDFGVQPQECQSTWCAARFACRYQNLPARDEESGGSQRGGA